MQTPQKTGLRTVLSIAALVIVMFIPFVAEAQQTASQLITQCKDKLGKSGGLTVGFTMTSGGNTVKGSVKTSGEKFAVTTPASATWYDGSRMWTYNPRSRETTLVTPSRAELNETNPLLIISSNLSGYTATFAKSQTAGKKTVILTPRTKGTGMKSLHVTINSKNLLPEKLVAVPASGQTITVNITSLKTGETHASSSFVYPASKYPGVTVVDLR